MDGFKLLEAIGLELDLPVISEHSSSSDKQVQQQQQRQQQQIAANEQAAAAQRAAAKQPVQQPAVVAASSSSTAKQCRSRADASRSQAANSSKQQQHSQALSGFAILWHSMPAPRSNHVQLHNSSFKGPNTQGNKQHM
jgi:hypothetical protein